MYKYGIVIMFVALCTACGSTVKTPSSASSTAPSASGTAIAVPATVKTDCASLTTTTLIAKVPAKCAALWQSYNVTEVPPNSVLQDIVLPTKVTNNTNGAISTATAQLWATDFARDEGWAQWAEKYGQSDFFASYASLETLSNSYAVAMNAGTISDPNCDMYPTAVSVFPITSAGSTYFAGINTPTKGSYVLVTTYTPPASGTCTVTAIPSSGASSTLFEFQAPVTTFQSGYVVSDPVLGQIWYPDATGACSQQNGSSTAVTQWCQASSA